MNPIMEIADILKAHNKNIYDLKRRVIELEFIVHCFKKHPCGDAEVYNRFFKPMFTMLQEGIDETDRKNSETPA